MRNGDFFSGFSKVVLVMIRSLPFPLSADPLLLFFLLSINSATVKDEGG